MDVNTTAKQKKDCASTMLMEWVMSISKKLKKTKNVLMRKESGTTKTN